MQGSYEATKAVAKKAQKKKIHFQVRQYSDEILGEPNYSVHLDGKNYQTGNQLVTSMSYKSYMHSIWTQQCKAKNKDILPQKKIFLVSHRYHWGYGFNRIWTHDLSDIGVILYQLSFETSLEAGQVCI